MKTKISMFLVTLLVAVAAIASDAPLVDAHLRSLTSAARIRNGNNPVNMKFEVTVTNRSDVPVTLTRVEVRADDTAGISLSDGSKKVSRTIEPGATEIIPLRARGIETKNVARSEALQVSVKLTFDAPGGKFLKEFAEFIQ